MIVTPKQNITADEAFEAITSGEALSNMFITGKLEFNKFYQDSFKYDLIADNCIIEHLQATCAQFAKTVKLTNSEIIKCEFNMTYFLGGLTIDNCIFENYLSFESGGHNENGNVVSITNSTFRKFVNFFDCLYFSKVVITNNNFLEGTNILGKPVNLPVRFEAEQKIENNKGQLDSNDEGDIESASVYLQDGKDKVIVQQMPEFLAGRQKGLLKMI